MSALKLDLSMPPDWSRIDPAREAVGLLVLLASGDEDLREAMAMASEELLENAVKYSKPGTSVLLTVTDDDAGLVVTVSNTIDETSSHAGALRKRVEWMQTFDDAGAAYTAAIGHVYRNAKLTGEAGLGIVRIAYEGRCGVDVDLSEAGRVTVRAARPKPT